MSVFLNVDKFYHTLSRAWELAFGGFIFILSYQHKEIINKILDKKWFTFGVIIFFIFSIALASNNNSYNIFKTFLIALSSGLLILVLTYSKEKFFYCRITLESYLKRASEYRNIVYSLAKNYKNVVVLDPINVFCDEKYCYAMKNSKLLYKDDDHVSLDGSFELAKFLVDKIVSDPVSH